MPAALNELAVLLLCASLPCPQLAAFHTHVLEAQGDGAWQLHTADDFLRQLKE